MNTTTEARFKLTVSSNSHLAIAHLIFTRVTDVWRYMLPATIYCAGAEVVTKR